MPPEKPLLIATYNEAENVEPLFAEIRNIGLNGTLLFVNDHSSDRTDRIVQKIAAQHSWVHVLPRDSKQASRAPLCAVGCRRKHDRPALSSKGPTLLFELSSPGKGTDA